MYFFFWFGELIGLAMIIAVGYLLFSNHRLKKRVALLEQARHDVIAGRDRIATPQRTDPEQSTTTTPEPAETVVDILTPPAAPTPPEPVEAPATHPLAAPQSTHADELPPRAFVFSEDQIGRFVAWAKENWFLLVAALSLAMAGVYLVQYGIEKGLLTPTMRVMGALAFGATLIGAAEWIRRRMGDEDGHTAFLPSTLAGAGLVSIFVGIFAARQLYGLIGPGTAFTGLSLTGLLALVLGWFYGPFLIAIGLIGGAAAPFLVGDSGRNPYGLYYYFALIAVIALGVDTIKRIAWISVLGLFLAFAAAALLFSAKDGALHYLAFAIITLAATATIPVRRLIPDHGGAMLLESLGGTKTQIWPDFPTRIAGGVMLIASFIAFLVSGTPDGSFTLSLTGVVILFLMATMWLSKTAALTDLVILPVVTFLAVIFIEAAGYGDTYRSYIEWQQINPEDSPPRTITLLVALTMGMSLIATLRGLFGAAYPRLWLIGAALLTPTAIIILDLLWYPPAVLGDWTWTLHVLAAATLMTLLAERSARADHIGNGPVAAFALAALTLISLALITMLSLTALTLALAAMTLGAAALDRRFNLPPLSWFVQLGALTTGWRLVLDPGIPFADNAPITELFLIFGGSIALLVAAREVLTPRDRPTARMVLESVALTAAAVFACVLLYRWIAAMEHANTYISSHWEIGLYATVWLISAAAQLYRRKLGGPLNVVRTILATIFALLGLLLVGLTLSFANPLAGANGMVGFDPVIGPPFLSSLLLAYGFPALVLFLTAQYLLKNSVLHAICHLIAGFLATVYVGFSIRHFWRGADLSVHGVTDPEQYSYTVAMLLVSVALIILAYLRRSPALRKLGMVGIALTIAKVYLIDAAGLTGLTRFFSFLLLGLVLIGLAWLNRLIRAAEDARDNPLDAPDP